MDPAATPADPLRQALEAAIGFQYEVLRLLGRGGMGAVYLVRERALDREVAIKVLPPERSETPEARERFRREARTAARLAHQHIVPLLTFGEVHGLVYYVMGYVRGESLAARLRREGSLSVEETRRILGELAEALAHAHRSGVVHRDLKPDNVLIEAESGRALLADFGIAKAHGVGQTLTATGSVVGTPHYMSPEQASGKADVDGRSDIYSLGVMGYEMLAGQRPFEGKTPADVLVQHMTQAPPRLAPRATGAPPDLVLAIERCLAKDPAQRFDDALSLRKALTEQESAELPDALGPVHALASVWLVWMIAIWFDTLFKWVAGRSQKDSFFADFPRNSAVVLGVLSLAVVHEARKKRHSWPAIRAALLRQPFWWRAGYPRRFRVAGDVWDRLPPRVRRFRNVFFPFVALFWLAMPTFAIFLLNASEQYARSGVRTIWQQAIPDKLPPYVMLGLIGVMAALFLFGRRAVHARMRISAVPVDGDEAGRMLWASTSRRSFWSQPGVAALLEPEPRSARLKTREAPTSRAELLASLSRRLSAWPEERRAFAEQLLAAARALASSVETLEGTLGELRRDLDADEAQRLATKLHALGATADAEPGERRELRGLLTRQLDLIRGLETRIASTEEERERRRAHLRRIWELTHAVDDRSGLEAAEALEQLRRLSAGPAATTEQMTLTRGDLAEKA